MVINESGLRKSFSEVKRDILEVKNQILRLAENQEKIESMVSDLKKRPPKKVKKTSKKKK